MSNAQRKYGGELSDGGIIRALIARDDALVISLIIDDPRRLNDINPTDGASAAMIIAQLGRSSMFEEMINFAEIIDFSYRDNRRRDLLDCAFEVGDEDVLTGVVTACRRWAPQLINNWPEP